MSSNANNSKAISQRQYREKEAEGFQELQLAIHEATGGRDVPDIRHEILTKAAQNIRELKQNNAQLRQQLTATSNPSLGVPGSSQGHGPGPGRNTANYYSGAPDFVISPWMHGYNTGYSGQGRHA